MLPKHSVLKLQNSQSGTVNGLLEEVRKAEERSASDRKKAAAEVTRISVAIVHY